MHNLLSVAQECHLQSMHAFMEALLGQRARHCVLDTLRRDELDKLEVGMHCLPSGCAWASAIQGAHTCRVCWTCCAVTSSTIWRWVLFDLVYMQGGCAVQGYRCMLFLNCHRMLDMLRRDEFDKLEVGFAGLGLHVGTLCCLGVWLYAVAQRPLRTGHAAL